MKKILFILAGANLISAQCQAWGKQGHHIVAEIAGKMMSEKTRNIVTTYLDSTSFNDASTWMDDMRKDHSYDHMKPWHYVNIAKGADYSANNDENVVNEVNKVMAELKHKDKLTNAQIKQDIMILFHLVGDIQQPLHAGYASDKGGNDIKVNYKGNATSLHWVWDNEIIESEHITVGACLAKGAAMPAKDSKITTDITQWISATRPLLTNVYAFDGTTISNEYITQNVPVIEQQLFLGGMRLAAVLDECFK